MDTSVFYPGERERGPTLARRERRAKQICARCPVVADCLRWALDAREPFGVWGGTSAKERARMLARRNWRGDGGADRPLDGGVGSGGSRLSETGHGGGGSGGSRLGETGHGAGGSGASRLGETGHDRREAEHVVGPGEIRECDE